jgi:Tol biopolymer transport system component/DNA-binding winged helix-turn-helix (wHTH) protein
MSHVSGDFRLASCLIQPSLNRIVHDGITAIVEPKIMQVLVRLAQSPREVVTKEEFFGNVWNGTFVTEDVLTRAIGELRKIFDDDPSRPRVIETIRKTGYRLLVPPVESPSASGDVPAESPPALLPDGRNPAVSRAAIAVAAGVALLAAIFVIRGFRSAGSSGPVRIIPVTTFPGNERHPALSPDGTRVAFAWERDGEKTSLYLKLLDAPTPVRLTNSPGTDDEPAWSPDGQKIAFVRRTKEACEIFSVPSIGGPVQRIADCGSRDAGKITWSPSGQGIALSGPAPGGALRIELLDPADGSRKVLTRPPPDSLGDEEPSFSPDGQRISFLRSLSDGVSDIYTVASTGGEPRQVTFENRSITGADWAPDGKSLIFSSNRAGLFSLWKIPSDGGEPRLLAGGGSKMKHPSTARRVNAVAYENWHYEVSLWRVPISGDRPEVQLTFAADEWEFDPEFSPDGSRIAYVSTKSGADEIWTTDRDGSAPTQLTSFGGPRLGMPRWSPDGRRLVFTARPEGQADLYSINASGGASVRLTSTPGDEAAPSWSRDGRSIYFAARRTGVWEVWRMPSSGGAAVRVTFHGGHTAYESVDGKWLFFSRADSPGIWRMPLGGGPETQTAVALAPNCWADWRVTGTGIYFKVDRNNDAPLVQFLPFDSSEAATVARLDHQAWAGFTVAPDDATIVYGRASRYDCDIRMVENGF